MIWRGNVPLHISADKTWSGPTSHDNSVPIKSSSRTTAAEGTSPHLLTHHESGVPHGSGLFSGSYTRAQSKPVWVSGRPGTSDNSQCPLPQ
ncbi:hypothetical protein GOODEAATRI_022612 [Goodea atripinnis]|uniref:Uncharacterized protein n=1 Tax=Goodea atripinnis TaxID=208336 RepID=A0ABV0NME0_9TELE